MGDNPSGQHHELDSLISVIKPLVRRLANKTDRQHAVKWIRRMRDESAVDSRQRRICCDYAKELLGMLRTGHLASPFHNLPPHDLLSPLILSKKHDDSLSALEDDSFYAPLSTTATATATTTAHQHMPAASSVHQLEGDGRKSQWRPETLGAGMTSSSYPYTLPSTMQGDASPDLASGHIAHSSQLDTRLASFRPTASSQNTSSAIPATGVTNTAHSSGPLSSYAPAITSQILTSSSSSLSSMGTLNQPRAQPVMDSFRVSEPSRPMTTATLRIQSQSETQPSYMLSMPPPLDYQHPVGGQQMPPAVPASVTSSALEAELMSSDDESLERLLASAKPPPGAEDLVSLAEESDGDSVENLLSSMPFTTTLPSRVFHSLPTTVSTSARPLLSSTLSTVATSTTIPQATLPSSRSNSRPSTTMSTESHRTASRGASSNATLSASPSPSLRPSQLTGDVHQSLRFTQLELEKLRVVHRAQAAQSEMTSSRLKEQIHQLELDLTATRQEASTSLDRLRAKNRNKLKALEEEWQRKVSEVIANCEGDKLTLQQHQTAGMQQLLEETEQRLHKVEEDHSRQSQSLGQTIAALEAKVAQLSNESEEANMRYIKLLQENSSMTSQLQASNTQAEELRSRCQQLEQQHLDSEEAHQNILDELRQTMEETLNQTRASAGEAHDQLQQNMRTVQHDLAVAKDLLATTQHQHQMKLQEMHSQTQTDRQRLVAQHMLELNSLKADTEQRLTDSNSQLQTCQAIISDKESLIRHLEANTSAIKEEARMTLEQFKQSIEQSSAHTSEEMTKQLSAIKRDLEQSKSARHKQVKEFQNQTDLMQQQHQAEVMKLRATFEREKALLIEDHRQQVSQYQQQLAKERESFESRLRTAIAEHSDQLQARSQRDTSLIKSLEEQLHQTQSELNQVNTRHKSHLLELTRAQADEQERSGRELESATSRFRTEMTQLRHQLQQEHSGEIDELLAKTNNRLQNIEADYTERVASITKSNQRLQRELRQTKAELEQARDSHSQEADSRESRHAEALIAMRQQHENALQTVQQEVDLQRNRVHHLEKKVRHRALHEEEKIAKLHQQFEDRIKGLLPEAVRHDLEDTITSLKRQVETLEQHTTLLQRQLDARHRAAQTSLTDGTSTLLDASPTKASQFSTPAARLPRLQQGNSAIEVSTVRNGSSKQKSSEWRATDITHGMPLTSTPKALN